MDNRKQCLLCNVRITPAGWSYHLKSQKHQRNDPNRTIQPRKRGRPKTVKIHREIKFHTSVFEEPNIHTFVRTKESALRSRLHTLEIENSRNFLDVRQFLNRANRIVSGNIN